MRALAAGFLGVLIVTTPAPTQAQNVVPSFVQEGKTYVIGILGSESEVNVIEIGTGPWIKVAADGEEFWINLNQVAVVQEVTPETRARSREAAYAAVMRSDLRNLVVAQESYFADYVTYGAALTVLNFEPSMSVTITINAASGIGWNATGTHARTATVCSISVGSGAAAVSDLPEGEPTCQEGAPPTPPPPPPAPALVPQCETFNLTDYNIDGSCFDAQPRPLVVTLVPRLADIPGTPSPATLAIKVNTDGSVALILVIEASNNETFTEAAVVYARNIEYNPAQKNGQSVVGWTQQIFRCCRQPF